MHDIELIIVHDMHVVNISMALLALSVLFKNFYPEWDCLSIPVLFLSCSKRANGFTLD